MIIKTIIILICIAVDTLWESNQEHLDGGGIVPPQELQFVRDAITSYYPDIIVTNVKRLGRHRLGFIPDAIIDIDTGGLKKGDTIVLQPARSKWFVVNNPFKLGAGYRCHIMSHSRTTTNIVPGDIFTKYT